MSFAQAGSICSQWLNLCVSNSLCLKPHRAYCDNWVDSTAEQISGVTLAKHFHPCPVTERLPLHSQFPAANTQIQFPSGELRSDIMESHAIIVLLVRVYSFGHCIFLVGCWIFHLFRAPSALRIEPSKGVCAQAGCRCSQCRWHPS